jgi:hypothetical protein
MAGLIAEVLTLLSYKIATRSQRVYTHIFEVSLLNGTTINTARLNRKLLFQVGALINGSTYLLTPMQDSNILFRTVPRVWGNAAEIFGQIQISDDIAFYMKMYTNQQICFTIAAILDLQLPVRSGSVGTSSIELVDLENVCKAVEIVSLSCMGAELKVIPLQ